MYNKKTIWIFNHHAQPPQYETRIRNNAMAKYLMEAGYDVTLFGASTIHNTDINLITDGSSFIRREYDGLKFVHIKAPQYHGNGLSRKINMLLFPYRLWKYTKRLEEKPDIIINDLTVMAMSFPFMIAKRYKCPIITEVRDLWPESIVAFGLLKRNSLLAKFLYAVERRMYLKSDRIVFSMEGGYDYIVERGWEKDIPREKVYHINNGVDLNTFLENRERHQIQDMDLEDPNTFKVVYAGAIRKANGVDQIVACADKLRDYNNIKFIIFGSGPDMEPLRDLCAAKGIHNVIFKGHVEKRYIPYILSRSDLNVLNYDPGSVEVFRFGSSQNKLFEYLASGKPILSNIQIAYSLVTSRHCGVEAENPTTDAMVEAILRIYRMSSEERADIEKNCQETAQDYDYKRLTQQLQLLIEDISH